MTLSKTITAPENQASGLHLLEGSLPSGKSRSRQIPSSPTADTHSHWLLSVPITTGNGTEPGLATP